MALVVYLLTTNSYAQQLADYVRLLPPLASQGSPPVALKSSLPFAAEKLALKKWTTAQKKLTSLSWSNLNARNLALPLLAQAENSLASQVNLNGIARIEGEVRSLDVFKQLAVLSPKLPALPAEYSKGLKLPSIALPDLASVNALTNGILLPKLSSDVLGNFAGLPAFSMLKSPFNALKKQVKRIFWDISVTKSDITLSEHSFQQYSRYSHRPNLRFFYEL